jgi:probable F420-dependent oxidoreductase
MYYDTLDPFVALAGAAALTSSIKLATGICLVVQRDPIHTAKEVASLDQLSQGRFLFGVGAGWNAEEMGNHGTAFDGRFKLMRERIEAMQAIWTEKEAAYHGDHVDFEPIYMWPKPVQKPHPPIHVGGGFPGGARRAVRYGNGWIPIGSRVDDLDQSIEAFRQMAKDAGRDPRELEVSLYGVSAAEKSIDRYRHAGVDRIVFGLPPLGRDELLPILDACGEARDQA